MQHDSMPRREAGGGSARPDGDRRSFATPTFGEAGPALEEAGFQTLPITPPDPGDRDAGKKPPASLARWQHPRPVAERLPRYAGCGVGLLTATTPAVDIDVRHLEIADAVDRVVVAALGDAPVRYGAAPKRLRLYRTSEPFPKVVTAGYRLPGDAPDAKAHKVEVLGAGQQFVAYGIHPGTGRPYFWPDDSPLDLERDDLPELNAELAARIVAAAETILAKVGAAAENRARAARPAAERLPGPEPRAVRDLAEARAVFDVLKSIDPSRLDRDLWMRTAYAVKAAVGEPGREPWLVWSRGSSKHGASGKSDTPERTWKSANPTRCGWRYLKELAEEIGHGG